MDTSKQHNSLLTSYRKSYLEIHEQIQLNVFLKIIFSFNSILICDFSFISVVGRPINNVYFQLILEDDPFFELMINLEHLFLVLPLIFNLLNFFTLISYHQYKLHKYLCLQLYLCV